MATAAAADVKDVQDIHDTTGKIISRAMGWSVAAAILPVPYLDIAALGTVQA